MNPQALLARRLAAQLLTVPCARSTEQVVHHLLAVQAQDGRGYRLAVRARSIGLTAADVDGALTNDRSVVITWFNRGTLHLVHRDDYDWLHALTNRKLVTAIASRLARHGLNADLRERGLRVIARALENGPMTRNLLRVQLEEADVPSDGQALIQLLAEASSNGAIVRGPITGTEQAFVLTEDWLGTPKLVDRVQALAELARRYLKGHGPATEFDLARWAGITLTEARSGLKSIASELEQTDEGLADLPRESHVEKMPEPRLLGPFDPSLLGWTSRKDILGAHTHVVTTNGIFRPFALVRGKAVGTWSMLKRRVTLDLLDPVDAADREILTRDGEAVEQFFGWRSQPAPFPYL